MINKTFYCEQTDHVFDVDFEAGKLEIMRLVGNCELETLPISAKIFKKISKQLEIEELRQQLLAAHDDFSELEKERSSRIIDLLDSPSLRDSQLALLAEEVNDLITRD